MKNFLLTLLGIIFIFTVASCGGGDSSATPTIDPITTTITLPAPPAVEIEVTTTVTLPAPPAVMTEITTTITLSAPSAVMTEITTTITLSAPSAVMTEITTTITLSAPDPVEIEVTTTITLPAPNFNSDFNNIFSEQRLRVITAVVNTLNGSITRGTNEQDSISVKDKDGNLMLYTINENTLDIVEVNNLRTGSNWATNPPPIKSKGYIFDSGSFASKALTDYENGDYYFVTGFWFRDENDFGVFADGLSYTGNLLIHGSANYKGKINGYYWGNEVGAESTDAPSISGDFSSDTNIVATFTNNDIDLVANFNIELNEIPIGIAVSGRDGNRDGGFYTVELESNANALCTSGCNANTKFINSNLNARFVGNPVNINGGVDSNGYPAGIVGVFGFEIQNIGNFDIDLLGNFIGIFDDLCPATDFCTKP